MMKSKMVKWVIQINDSVHPSNKGLEPTRTGIHRLPLTFCTPTKEHPSKISRLHEMEYRVKQVFSDTLKEQAHYIS